MIRTLCGLGCFDFDTADTGNNVCAGVALMHVVDLRPLPAVRKTTFSVELDSDDNEDDSDDDEFVGDDADFNAAEALFEMALALRCEGAD